MRGVLAFSRCSPAHRNQSTKAELLWDPEENSDGKMLVPFRSRGEGDHGGRVAQAQIDPAKAPTLPRRGCGAESRPHNSPTVTLR
jgi:hypothetical protein